MMRDGQEAGDTHTPGNPKGKNRFVELDVLRGIAILAMVYLHVIWDLDYFGIAPLNTEIYRNAPVIPAMFLLIAGICLSVSFNRGRGTEEQRSWALIKRGMYIYCVGLVIAVGSLVFIPEAPVFFGILNCIGISIVLSTLVLRWGRYNLLLGAIIALLGISPLFVVDFFSPALAVIGFHPLNVNLLTIDYFPLFPWMGVMFFGIGLGGLMYSEDKRRYRIPAFLEDLKNPVVGFLSFTGRYSLLIYVTHQPIIGSMLFIATRGSSSFLAFIVSMFGRFIGVVL